MMVFSSGLMLWLWKVELVNMGMSLFVMVVVCRFVCSVLVEGFLLCS